MWSLYFLNCVNHISNWCEEQHRAFLSALRQTIGADPEKVFLLNQGAIVSSQLEIPEAFKLFVYDPVTNRMAPLTNVPDDARYRPVPFLSLSVKIADRTICLDDWIGAFRTYNCPELTLQKIVLLWATANHVYIPTGSTIQAMNDEGDEVTELTD